MALQVKKQLKTALWGENALVARRFGLCRTHQLISQLFQRSWLGSTGDN
jgi:hypothetical protein